MLTPGIDMQSVMGLFEIESTGRPGFYRCPRCGHGGLSMKDEVWFCHASCHEGGGPVSLAAFVWGVDVGSALKRVKKELGIDGEVAESVVEKEIDRAEAAPDAGTGRREILAAIDAYWMRAAMSCREARSLGIRIDEDDWFLPVRDAVDDKVIRDVGTASEWAGKALRRIVAILDRFGVPRPTEAKKDRKPTKAEVVAGKSGFSALPATMKMAAYDAARVLSRLAPGPYRDAELDQIAYLSRSSRAFVLALGASAYRRTRRR